jgi:hypothetical protein
VCVHTACAGVRAHGMRCCACTRHALVCVRTACAAVRAPGMRWCACTRHALVCVHTACAGVRAHGMRWCACARHALVCVRTACAGVRAHGMRWCACARHALVCVRTAVRFPTLNETHTRPVRPPRRPFDPLCNRFGARFGWLVTACSCAPSLLRPFEPNLLSAMRGAALNRGRRRRALPLGSARPTIGGVGRAAGPRLPHHGGRSRRRRHPPPRCTGARCVRGPGVVSAGRSARPPRRTRGATLGDAERYARCVRRTQRA